MTAVEWLYEILTTENWEYKTCEEQNAIFIKAHAMEENQHLQTFSAGQDSMEEGGKNFEQYYNDAYGLPSEH